MVVGDRDGSLLHTDQFVFQMPVWEIVQVAVTPGPHAFGTTGIPLFKVSKHKSLQIMLMNENVLKYQFVSLI